MTVRVTVVIGTRPEAIKQAPAVWALKRRAGFQVRVLSTGQHREMLGPMLDLLDLEVDDDLDLMQQSQTLTGLTSRALEHVDRALAEHPPDVVLVQGDTTTAMASALAAFNRHLLVGHVEAGLRSGNLEEPFPEEVNRRVIDTFARFLFAPTTGAKDKLLAEGIAEDRVSVTGNTVVDALLAVRKRVEHRPLDGLDLPEDVFKQRFVLVTAHRRESFGDTLRGMMSAIGELATRHPDTHFVYPVHLNPNVVGPVKEILGGRRNVHLLRPLDYESFVQLLSRAYLVMSDSGGVQEEAPSFGVPVLILRNCTERPEAVEVGCNRLVGTDPETIFEATDGLLRDHDARARMAAPNPYGDGLAGERIADVLAAHFGVET